MKNIGFHPCPCNRIYYPWAIDSQTNRNRFLSFFLSLTWKMRMCFVHSYIAAKIKVFIFKEISGLVLGNTPLTQTVTNFPAFPTIPGT